MHNLIHYLPLCLGKINPIELPKSTPFLMRNLLFFIVVQYILQANATDDVIESFFEVSLEIILTIVFMAMMLHLNHSLHALSQVLMAILFCANALSIILILLVVWLTLSEDIISYYSIGLLFLWYFVIIGKIIKKILQVNTAASLALTFFYFIFAYAGAFVVGQLF